MAHKTTNLDAICGREHSCLSRLLQQLRVPLCPQFRPCIIFAISISIFFCLSHSLLSHSLCRFSQMFITICSLYFVSNFLLNFRFINDCTLSEINGTKRCFYHLYRWIVLHSRLKDTKQCKRHTHTNNALIHTYRPVILERKQAWVWARARNWQSAYWISKLI